MNTAAITGRLTKDIELRTTSGGHEYANFDVAVKRPYRTGGEDKTDFIHCKAWRQSARFLADYAHKGDTVGIEGAVQVDRYPDRNGTDRDWWYINVNRAELVSRKGEGGSSAPAARNSGSQQRPKQDDYPGVRAVMDDVALGEMDGFAEDAELPF